MASVIATLLLVIRVLTWLSKSRYYLTVIVKMLTGAASLLMNADVAKDSSNSGQPPSSDSVKKGRKSLGKTGKPLGGQKGHEGATHLFEEDVTHREEVLEDIEKYRNNPLWIQVKETRRQILDIKLERVVIELVNREFRNTETGETVSGEFPDDANTNLQFGLTLRTFVVFMRDHEHIPYKRLTELIFGLFNLNIQESTLINIIKEAETSEVIRQFKEAAKTEIQESEVVCADESSVRVANPDPEKSGGKNSWSHFLVSKLFTLVTLSWSRGKEGADASGILEKFKGSWFMTAGRLISSTAASTASATPTY
jgi:transposase